MEAKTKETKLYTPWRVVDSRKFLGEDGIELSDHNFQISDNREFWIANINKGIHNDEVIANLIAQAPALSERVRELEYDLRKAESARDVAMNSAKFRGELNKELVAALEAIYSAMPDVEKISDLCLSALSKARKEQP